MNLKALLGENAVANGHHGAQTGQSGHVQEDAKAKGVYSLLCQAPSDKDLPRYLALRDQLAFIESQKLIARVALSSQREILKKEFDEIELHPVWNEPIILNLVTTVGGNNMLDNHLSGSSYTAAWYIGLISTTSYTAVALTDTMASHPGWTESVAYSNASRPSTAWSAASGKSKALSAGLVFNMNASDTITGCFLTSNSTKSGTTGTLYSAGLFTSGNQPVVNGNTLTVMYTALV